MTAIRVAKDFITISPPGSSFMYITTKGLKQQYTEITEPITPQTAIQWKPCTKADENKWNLPKKPTVGGIPANDKSKIEFLTGLDYLFLKILYSKNIKAGMRGKPLEQKLKNRIQALHLAGEVEMADEKVKAVGLYPLTN